MNTAQVNLHQQHRAFPLRLYWEISQAAIFSMFLKKRVLSKHHLDPRAGGTVRVGGSTNIGMVREVNQDSFLVDDSLGLYVVADGMGGHVAGERASLSAVTTIRDYFSQYNAETGLFANGENPISIVDAIREALRDANDQILLAAHNDATLTGMGTTVVVVFSDKGKLYIGHIGDSRGYLLRENEFYQITEDHSVVQQLVRAGAITQEEASVHPYRNVITRCLGMQTDIEADLSELELRQGDRVLVCTDGLSGQVSHEQMQEIISTYDDPQACCEELIRMANVHGGPDNITAVLLYLDS